MNTEALEWLRTLMKRNRIYVENDPNCLMSYIEKRLLPLYGVNRYKTQNADYMIRKMTVIDTVCKVLPVTIFPLHEEQIILIGLLADLSWTLPDHRFIAHHMQTVKMLCKLFHDDPWLQKYISDIDRVKKIILDIFNSTSNHAYYHRGELISYVLHDVDILTAEYDIKILINDLYHDIKLSHPKITDTYTLKSMTYRRLRNRIGEHGIYKPWIPNLAEDPFFKRKRDLVYAALKSEEEMEKYLDET